MYNNILYYYYNDINYMCNYKHLIALYYWYLLMSIMRSHAFTYTFHREDDTSYGVTVCVTCVTYHM